jgi:hypothetical protein
MKGSKEEFEKFLKNLEIFFGLMELLFVKK